MNRWLIARGAGPVIVALLALAGAAGAQQPGPLGLPMSRDGSGTAWLPDASPVYAWHRARGSWTFMLHDNSFLQFLADGGARGSRQLGSTNWIMGMARRPLAGGTVGFRGMFSIEAATVGACGYPDLLATGEECGNGPLHDRQHPHDLFMELVVDYHHALTDRLAAQVYAGPVGEPALGPVAFPHRVSAMANPIAPISHHWLDATHIAFGVVTAGLYTHTWKLEGSAFNGREPDRFRYGIESGRLDSYSGRAWFLPGNHWALQASAGRLVAVETDTLGAPESLTRLTASATYTVTMPGGRTWAATAAWGANRDPDRTTHAAILEGTLILPQEDALSGRAELTQKSGHDLALPGPPSDVFVVGKVAVGYSHTFPGRFGLAPGLGVTLSVSVVPPSLAPFYGRRALGGIGILASVRPPRMRGEHADHDMSTMP